MRIFVTGASGFVGKALVARLLESGHEVIALVHKTGLETHDRLKVVNGSLDKPSLDWGGGSGIDAVIHSAWISTPGEYLSSPYNDEFARWSEELLPLFGRLGVKRFVGVGTCIECPPSSEPLPEKLDYEESPPRFPYVDAKVKWRRSLLEWGQREGVSVVWARLFYPYGIGEHPGRFPSFLIRKLASAEEIVLKTPFSVKDYINIADVSEALAILACNVTAAGAYHVGSGRGLRIVDLANALADEVGAPRDLVKIPPVADRAHDDFPYHVADPKGLRNLGWSPRISLEVGLKQLVENLLNNENRNR